MNILTRQEKIDILNNGFDDCLKNHTCGMYISIGEHCLQWDILIKKRSYFLTCDDIKLKYDFFFSFDENLQALYDSLVKKYLDDYISYSSSKEE